MDELAKHVVRHGEDPELLDILHDLVTLTGMGFAAVAHVTEDRWIACQSLDNLEFGLTPGGELDVGTTICDDIRKTRQAIVIDHVDADQNWCTHPTPVLYGFQSYISLPLTLSDGSFYGTLCAIDPRPRLLNKPRIVSELEALARRAEAILSERVLAKALSPLQRDAGRL